MRIAVDATPLLLRSAGVKTYLYHWLRHLREAAPPGSVEAFPRIRRWGELNHEASHLPYLSTQWRLALLHALNLGLPGARTALIPRVDVFHASNQVRRPPRRTLVTATVHDMTCWLLPELHTAANVRADRDFARAVLQRADGLIAVSENTRRDLIRLLGAPLDRVEVIYPGVDPAYFDVSPARVEISKSRLGLPRPYLLSVGTIEPRKNVDTLLDAYELLSPDRRARTELIVAGPAGWNSERTVARLGAAPAGIRYLEYVPETLLPGLFAGATALVYPSLYEGFGFPVAQAMAAGTAVVTSATSSLAEVAGDSALLIDPRSATEIAASIEQVLDSPGLRAELGRRGRSRARALFHWPDCAARSWRFFERVFGRAGS